MRVEKGKTVIARGEVCIAGEAEVCGARVSKFFAEKFVPIYCLEDCEVEVKGDFKILDRCTIPDSWKRLAEKDWDVLFLYGGVDVGKSTLALYLANKTGGCYVLDLDIGQSELLHPAAMGYGYVENCVSLAEAKLINSFFVGCISPMGKEAKCLRAVAKLWNELRMLEGRKIINTTGWVRGARAKDYKLAKLEIIQPDLIAAFEEPDFDVDFEVFRVESGEVMERSREERAKIRMEKYRRELDGSKLFVVEKGKVSGRFFRGRTIQKDFIEEVLGKKVLEVRRGSDYLLIITEKRFEAENSILKSLRELYEVEDVYIVSKEELEGLVVGVYKEKRYLGLGLLKEYRGSEIVIQTRHQEFDKIVFGDFGIQQGKEYMLRLP